MCFIKDYTSYSKRLY